MEERCAGSLELSTCRTTTATELSNASPLLVRKSSVKFDLADNEPPAPQQQRTAKGRWIGATVIAKLVGSAKRIGRLRQQIGLDPLSEVPLDVVGRAELMAHWQIHILLVRVLQQFFESHPDTKGGSGGGFSSSRRGSSSNFATTIATVENVLSFFYYFVMSPANAALLIPWFDVFARGIHHTSTKVRTTSMHIVVAIMSARAM